MYSVRVDDAIELAMPMDYHAGPVYAIIDSERDRLARWLPGLPASAEEQVALFRRRRDSIAAGTFYSFVITVRGEAAGTIGMGPLTESTAELGYLLAARFEGRGIVTRSIATLIDRAIEGLAVHRFEIYCDPANRRSRAIARRLGFRHEGTLRQVARVDGGYRDQELHALLSPEWRAGTVGETVPEAAAGRVT